MLHSGIMYHTVVCTMYRYFLCHSSMYIQWPLRHTLIRFCIQPFFSARSRFSLPTSIKSFEGFMFGYIRAMLIICLINVSGRHILLYLQPVPYFRIELTSHSSMIFAVWIHTGVILHKNGPIKDFLTVFNYLHWELVKTPATWTQLLCKSPKLLSH